MGSAASAVFFAFLLVVVVVIVLAIFLTRTKSGGKTTLTTSSSCLLVPSTTSLTVQEQLLPKLANSLFVAPKLDFFASDKLLGTLNQVGDGNLTTKTYALTAPGQDAVQVKIVQELFRLSKKYTFSSCSEANVEYLVQEEPSLRPFYSSFALSKVTNGVTTVIGASESTSWFGRDLVVKSTSGETLGSATRPVFNALVADKWLCTTSNTTVLPAWLLACLAGLVTIKAREK
jgi:hypothetical protein